MTTLADSLLGRSDLLQKMEKLAYAPPGPVPPGPDVPPDANAMVPPPDPAMMGGGAPMPPVDPATGMPMDPAMMGGGAPMPPVDPATGMPMDPAMMGGAPSADPAAGGEPPAGEEMIPASALDEIIGPIMERLDEMQGKFEEMAERLESAEKTKAPVAAEEGREAPMPVMEDLGVEQPVGSMETDTDQDTPGEMAENEELAGGEEETDPMKDDKRPGDGTDKASMTPLQRLTSMQGFRRT